MDSKALDRPFIYRARPWQARLRRCSDVVIAATALIAASPILAIACAAIAIEDGRPFLFTQRRVGRFERTFRIYKLRTMRKDDCSDQLSPRNGRDRRITRTGAILRKLSIDELPQLFNILLGDMTVVGPRPEMPFVVARYERWQNLRHLATPGLTCIWQTTVRKTIPLETPEATKLDLEYLDTASPLLDSRLMLRTIRAIFFPQGAF